MTGPSIKILKSDDIHSPSKQRLQDLEDVTNKRILIEDADVQGFIAINTDNYD